LKLGFFIFERKHTAMASPSDTLKSIAVDFLTRCAAGEAQAAFRDHVHPGFIHHNAWFAGDAESLWQAMDANAADHPDKVFDIRHILEDGPMVACHSFFAESPGEKGMAVVHLMRFEGNQIIEFWDLAQSIPEQMANKNGMF